MNKEALTPLDLRRILLFSLVGAPIGAGAASLVSAANRLKTQKEMLDASDPDKMDDNVLYIDLPGQGKMAADAMTKATIPGTVMAGTAGLLSLLGSYAFVRRMAQQRKMKELQDELDQEQQLYLQGLTDPAQFKTAAERPVADASLGKGEMFWGFPLMASLLTALGSGVITHRALDSIFPTVNRKDVADGPPRVVFRRRQQMPDAEDIPLEDEEEAQLKAACNQLGLQTAFSMAFDLAKSARDDSDFVNLVAAVGHGRLKELEDEVMEGRGGMLDVLVKGAAAKPLPAWRAELAFAELSRSHTLKTAAAVLAAGELGEYLPTLTKAAADMDPDVADYVATVAAAFRIPRVDHLYKLGEHVKEIPANVVPASKALEMGVSDPDQEKLDALFQDIFAETSEEESTMQTPLDTLDQPVSAVSNRRDSAEEVLSGVEG